MVLCTKCGVENPLGRVFCGACGARLDLRDMSSEHMAERAKPHLFLNHWPKLVALIVLVLAGLAGLAFWPQQTPVGKKGTRMGGQRAIGALRAMADNKSGRTLGRDFTEEDINGFFEFFKAKKLNVESLSLQVANGYFKVRVIQNVGTLPLGSYRIEPRVSYDLLCVPVSSSVRVSGAAMGHLQWLGPAKSTVVRKVYGLLAKEPEWATFADLSEVRADEGKLWVSVSKK